MTRNPQGYYLKAVLNGSRGNWQVSHSSIFQMETQPSRRIQKGRIPVKRQRL